MLFQKNHNRKEESMAYSPHPVKRISDIPPQGKKEPCLTSPQVMDMALKLASDYLPISRPEGADYSPKDIISVLLYAAAQRTTIEQTCWSLEGAPHPNTVRLALTPLEIEEIESRLNEGFKASLPRNLLSKPIEAAIDLKLVPYWGKAKEGEEEFLISGKPQHGTTKFFGYASIYLIKKDKRFTLGVRAVRRSEGLLGALRWCIKRLEELGAEVRCLYVDRQFFGVKVLRFLIEEKDIPFVMPAPERGKKGGIKGLLSREGPGVYPYKVRSPKEGEITVQVAIVGRYFKGKWEKHERKRYAFVVHRFPFRIGDLFKRYRRRFGIESSHRIWDQARARTASRMAGLRLLLIGLAILLHNLWVLLKWAVVSLPRRGGRLVISKRFPFYRLLSFLSRAIEEKYKWIEAIVIY